jgi:hypothetical protein
VEEHEVVAFNRLGVAGLSGLRSLMESWAVPVAGKFSYATLAACAIEMMRRAIGEDGA